MGSAVLVLVVLVEEGLVLVGVWGWPLSVRQVVVVAASHRMVWQEVASVKGNYVEPR